MITITDKTKCCGCQACANICPKNCVIMKVDEEGFLYPQVNQSACVNCGLCEKVCPILNKPQTFSVLETYAAKHDSAEVKMKSSSGGIFSALAEVILKEGGVVFGAAFDKEWNVVHTYVEKLEDLDKLRRSKYVQSDIGKTYQQTKQFLEQGRKVLFAGTPCQIAALRNYLGKEHENLVTVDLFCHGVPSPKVWHKFLIENFNISQIININFRDKYFAWNKSFLSILLSDGWHIHNGHVGMAEFFPLGIHPWLMILNNTYYHAFLADLISRPSCYSCHFKQERIADFSIGDLWGKWPDILTKLDQKQGVSALLVNSSKAKNYLLSLSIFIQPVQLERVCKGNKLLLRSSKAHPKRAEFFARYQTEEFNKLVRECLDLSPLWLRIVKKVYKKFLKNG